MRIIQVSNKPAQYPLLANMLFQNAPWPGWHQLHNLQPLQDINRVATVHVLAERGTAHVLRLNFGLIPKVAKFAEVLGIFKEKQDLM